LDTLSKFTIPGILLLLTLGSGFWLSSSGRPYSGILFNVHKLIALGVVIVAVIQFVQVFKDTNPQAVGIALLVLGGVCAVALFATGALMSMGKLDDTVTLTIHRIASVAMVVAMAAAVYLLAREANAS
jgi:hypothetical protein